jgi:hypothetical protein
MYGEIRLIYRLNWTAHTHPRMPITYSRKKKKNDFTTSVRNSRNGNSRLKHPLSNFIP